ncbi:hypothetical protein D3C76_905200 [compost metagenome]
MHVVAADVAVHQGQAGNAEGDEVVVVTHLPGLLFGVVIAGVVAVVGQGPATGAVDPHPHVVAAEFLQADVEGVAAVFGREQGKRGLVVEVAGQGAAVFLADEVAEVGAQGPVADGLAVAEVEILLLIDIAEFGIPDADLGAFVVEGVFAAAEVESVRGEGGRFAVHEHVFHARIVARAVLAELPAIERQAADFGGGHLAAAEGLRQRATVIGAQDRQHRHPFADLQFGFRDLAFECHAQAPEVVGRAAVTMDRQQLRSRGALAAVELLRVQPQHIHTEAHRALGIAGFGVEDEVLCPLLSLALRVGRVGVVAIEVGVAQVQRGFGVIGEAFGLAGDGQGEGQAAATDQAQRLQTGKGRAWGTGGRIEDELAHCDAPLLLFCFYFCHTSSYNIGEDICGIFGGCQSEVIR